MNRIKTRFKGDLGLRGELARGLSRFLMQTRRLGVKFGLIFFRILYSISLKPWRMSSYLTETTCCAFRMSGIIICMLGISSQSNYWQHVFIAILEIPGGSIPTALEMSPLYILRNRTINKDTWKKRATFPDCQVKYNFVIEVSCSAFGKAGITCSFL